jgi:hypothetical protein
MFGIGGKEYAFRKRINRITFDRLNLEEFYVDFSKLDDQLQINGLIGLAILLKGKFIIDLNKRELYLPN